ncbi:hemolysin III family protein [Virgibacillus soli]|uniref:PAQR family membrane homeostasis protein TrhA n=1 Tax=Paracerasibacillus soli TaxID=480284 RepID=UPI0035EA2E95
MTNYIREPINGLTHLFGAILSFVGLLALIIKASITTESAIAIMAVTIFGISMILLYAASATYHSVIARDHVIAFLRKVDHSMIFVLIAGTYTPFCLISLHGLSGWILFSVISAIALFGVLFKLIWFQAPRWLSTSIYIAMGWIVIFFSPSLGNVIGRNGLILLIVGGVIYTIGGFIYWIKPKFMEFKHLGYHEIFHVFILLGSFFHFWCIFKYVI